MDAERERATAALEGGGVSPRRRRAWTPPTEVRARAPPPPRERALRRGGGDRRRRTSPCSIASAPWRLGRSQRRRAEANGRFASGGCSAWWWTWGRTRGAVTLAESSGVTPAPGCAFSAAVAGARARGRDVAEACAGDVTAVLQRVVPALRRAEKTLELAEECRSAFPRVARVRCTAGGTSNSPRRFRIGGAKSTSRSPPRRGAYPTHAARARSCTTVTAETPSARASTRRSMRAARGRSRKKALRICRLAERIVARGGTDAGDAAQRAAVAAKPAPAACAPPILVGASRGLPIVRPREESRRGTRRENILAAEDTRARGRMPRTEAAAAEARGGRARGGCAGSRAAAAATGAHVADGGVRAPPPGHGGRAADLRGHGERSAGGRDGGCEDAGGVQQRVESAL